MKYLIILILTIFIISCCSNYNPSNPNNLTYKIILKNKSTSNFEAFTASGLTYNKKPRITVITRYEEIDKLLFHELIHNYYLDGSKYHREIKNVILTYEKSKNDDNYNYEYSSNFVFMIMIMFGYDFDGAHVDVDEVAARDDYKHDGKADQDGNVGYD